MSQVTTHRWVSMQDDDSREVERVLRQGFPRTDDYRYNAASIRVRVIDERFRGKSLEERDGMVEPYIHQLPETLQADIMRLFALTPPDGTESFRDVYQNEEFENPDDSDL